MNENKNSTSLKSKILIGNYFTRTIFPLSKNPLLFDTVNKYTPEDNVPEFQITLPEFVVICCSNNLTPKISVITSFIPTLVRDCIADAPDAYSKFLRPPNFLQILQKSLKIKLLFLTYPHRLPFYSQLQTFVG